MQDTPIQNRREPFFNNVPPGVLILGALIIGIEMLLQVFGLEWRSAAFLFLAFFPLDFSTPYKELFFGQNLVMFFSYSFLHGNFFHMITNVAILFAFGKQIEEQVGLINFILIFISTAIAGSVTYQVIASGNPLPMVGASGGVFGFFGFLQGRDLFYRIKNRLTVLPFLNLVFWLVILHVILILLHPAIIPFQIGWHGHLGGFIFAVLLAGIIKR